MTKPLFKCAPLLLFLGFAPALAVEDLLSILDEEPLSWISSQGSNIVSQHKVGINFALIKTESRLRFPGGHILKKDSSDEEFNSEGYMALRFKKGRLEYSVLTIHQHDGYEALNGVIHDPSDEGLMSIRNCGESCHLLVRSKVIMENGTIGNSEISPVSLKSFQKNITDASASEQATNRAVADRIIYMVCYYTAEYELNVGVDYIHTEIEDLNCVMWKNKLFRFRFKFVCLCILPATGVDESKGAMERFNDIGANLGPWSKLMQTADMAVVFYSSASFDSVCGMALNIDPLRNGGIPLTWFGYMCNTYTLPHEIGHLLNARHNIEIDPTPGINHGYLIPSTDGFTIMAYSHGSHTKRIPYFSTPASYFFMYKRRRIGNRHQANNRLVIVLAIKRYILFGNQGIAVCGDMVCEDISTLECLHLVLLFTCESLVARFYCPAWCELCD